MTAELLWALAGAGLLLVVGVAAWLARRRAGANRAGQATREGRAGRDPRAGPAGRDSGAARAGSDLLADRAGRDPRAGHAGRDLGAGRDNSHRQPPAAQAARAAATAPSAAQPINHADHADHAHQAQRAAAIEALRQARRRAADDSARIDAGRQAGPALLPVRTAPLPGPAQRPAGAAPPPVALPPDPAPTAATPAALMPWQRAASGLMPATASATPSATPSATASATLSATRLAAASATPSAAASVVASPVPSASPQPTAYPPPPLPVAPPRGASTVLVVDDSKVVRIKTSRLLEKNHYRVLLADDGLTALQQVAQQWPDLVITDVEMPGLDGFGLTQRLREFAHGPALPVLMITSSDDKHRDAAARAGVTVLLGKPYAEERLLAEVEKALGRVAQPAPAGMALPPAGMALQ